MDNETNTPQNGVADNIFKPAKLNPILVQLGDLQRSIKKHVEYEVAGRNRLYKVLQRAFVMFEDWLKPENADDLIVALESRDIALANPALEVAPENRTGL